MLGVDGTLEENKAKVIREKNQVEINIGELKEAMIKQKLCEKENRDY